MNETKESGIVIEQAFSRRDERELPVAVPAASTPMAMLAVAVQKGMDVATIQGLMDLQERWERNEARKAFVADMAAFKCEPIEIMKDSHVAFKTEKGWTEYNHASIGNVVDKIVAGLARHGFSHRWEPKRSDGGMISITCLITHKLGHSESTTLEAGLDQTGGKNNIQAMISTTTYLQRHSLLAATGLATKDQPDDDGKGGKEDGDKNDTKPPAKEPDKPSKKSYAPEAFAKKLPGWQGQINDGSRTPDDILATLATRYELTAEQTATIKSMTQYSAGDDKIASDSTISLLKDKARAAAISDADIFKKFEMQGYDRITNGLVKEILVFIANPTGEPL